MQKHTACILQSEGSRYEGNSQSTCSYHATFQFIGMDRMSRKERKEIAIEGPKKGRNGIEFFTAICQSKQGPLVSFRRGS
ncbi:hypothetical protein Peur_010439 [Populus x canadensis]